MNGGWKMKKVKAVILAAVTALSLGACSSRDPAVMLKDDVSFKLMDALKVTNQTTNTVYYYYLASVDNQSQEAYPMDSLSFKVTDEANDEIHAIDRKQTIIAKSVQPSHSTLVYGYTGYPNNDQKHMGLLFSRNGGFIPFDAVRLRQISDKNVTYSDEEKFTLYEDRDFAFRVDASNAEYSYEKGNSYVKGLVITYENKTDDRLVVPYITPLCHLTGIRFSDYKDKGNLADMSLDEIRKVDFKTDGMAPKTEPYEGTASGYECLYLDPEMSLPCTVDFTFEGVIPDFANYNPKSLTIDLNSASLGYSQELYIPY
mgnify:CR=1 FL=1